MHSFFFYKVFVFRLVSSLLCLRNSWGILFEWGNQTSPLYLNGRFFLGGHSKGIFYLALSRRFSLFSKPFAGLSWGFSPGSSLFFWEEIGSFYFPLDIWMGGGRRQSQELEVKCTQGWYHRGVECRVSSVLCTKPMHIL